jgi:membrane-bound lytic murein transglycosylase D
MQIRKWLFAATLLFLAPAARGEAPVTAIEPDSGLAGLKISDSLGSNGLDLWDRVRSGFALEPLLDPRVTTHLNWYAHRPEYLNRIVERSRRYLYHIVEEVERRGMPMEIALLPVIESGFNPYARSRAMAGGIWQFIPSTGKHFGLMSNGWYDGRLDILAGTEAALGYLQELYDRFGDWHLALAAYNCGEGCVTRAVARNRARGKATDFASLSLPTETRHYVPKLLAMRQIIEEPEEYGITLGNIENQPYFVPVSLSHPMDMSLAAKLAEIGMDEMKSLNPAYKRPVIHSSTPLTLLLPAGKAERFASKLEQHKPSIISVQTYDAVSGEKLEDIAKQFGTSVQWLKERNPVKTRRDELMRNQTLIVPAPADSETETERLDLVQSRRVGEGFSDHVVQQGENLQAIARRHRVNPASIMAWNPKSREGLKPGQVLRIPPGEYSADLVRLDRSKPVEDAAMTLAVAGSRVVQ